MSVVDTVAAGVAVHAAVDAAAGNAGDVEVDIALHLLASPRGQRWLVLRRTVTPVAAGERADAVAQLWISLPYPSELTTAAGLRTMFALCGSDLLLARPLRTFPELRSPTEAELGELMRGAAGRVLRVDHLVEFRGTVTGAGRDPVLRDGEVTAAGSLVATQARWLFIAALRTLRLRRAVPASVGGSDGAATMSAPHPPREPAADLAADLAADYRRLADERYRGIERGRRSPAELGQAG